MLIPNKLASISVTRRPSIKLKITPHIHPKASPLKNIAKILPGDGRIAKPTKANSAKTIAPKINILTNKKAGPPLLPTE